MKTTDTSHALIATDQATAHSLSSTLEPSSSSSAIARRTLLQSPELRVVLFHFSPGQQLLPHSSPRRAWVCIIEGKCDFFFEGEWHTLSAGAALHLPPGHTHAVKASSGPFVMTLTLGSASH